MSVLYTVHEQFGIPSEFHHDEIPYDKLQQFASLGVELRDIAPSTPLLALVQLDCVSFNEGQQWGISARPTVKRRSDSFVFGHASFDTDNGSIISPDEALVHGTTWIRESKNTEFVPVPPINAGKPEWMKNRIYGYLLVRAASNE
jgi:hypothetical protein